MKTVDFRDAKTSLSALRIVISRNGRPAADLVPHQRPVSMEPDKEMRNAQVFNGLHRDAPAALLRAAPARIDRP